MNGSNWTGRTARTLSEAFGHYADEQIDDTGSRWHDDPLALLLAAVVGVLCCWAAVATLFIWSQQ